MGFTPQLEIPNKTFKPITQCPQLQLLAFKATNPVSLPKLRPPVS